MKEPVWVSLGTLHLLHDRQLELFGGLRGIRDEGSIASALARPVNAWMYEQAVDLETIAATYLCALVRQQGYLDGNKRTALAAMLVFLRLNGRRLDAPGPELYATVMNAATGAIDAATVAEWLRTNVK